MSAGRMRTARERGLAANASDPRPSPVSVIRCQNRGRGPRNVAVNAATAATPPIPSANRPGGRSRDAPGPSATNDAGQQDPGDQGFAFLPAE